MPDRMPCRILVPGCPKGVDPLVSEFPKKGRPALTGEDFRHSLRVVQGSETPLSMRRFRRVGGVLASLLVAASALVAAPHSAGATSPAPDPLPALEAGEPTSRYIVTAESSADRTSLVAALTEAGVTIREEFTEVLEGVAVSLTAEQYLALKNDPRVASISRDTVVSLESTLASEVDNSSKDGDIIPGRFVIQTKPALALSAKASILDIIGDGLTAAYTRAITGYAAELSSAQVDALNRHPGVVLVEPDRVIRAAATQNNATWGLDRIDQRDLPLSTTFSYIGSGAGVTAYVIDSGIAPHADFGTRLASGFAVSGLGSTVDANGHGTHVAGTIGGATWGVAKEAMLVPVRVLDASGAGSTSGVISGINWVITNHQAAVPAVANLSLGGGVSSSLDSAISNLVNDGVVTVVAAGNSNADACGTSPARAPSAVTVGATGSTDARSSFSNYGTCLDLFAPGSGITSTWLNGGTRTISGTSMAAPHVAGAVASYWSGALSKTRQEVTADIIDLATANKVSSAGTGSTNKLLYLPPEVQDPPGAPSGATATIVSGGVTVTWAAPTSSGGGPITSYDVVTASGVAACSASGTALSCTVSGLTPGTYEFKVRATNAFGSSEYSSLSNSVVFTGAGDNNYFVGRLALDPDGGPITTSNLNATREVGEPTIGWSSTYRTLWYSFLPAEDGTLTLDLAGSSFDTVLGVFTGTDVVSLTKIDENDDENFPEGVLTSRLSLRVDNGVDYKIQVGSYWDQGGTVKISTTFVALAVPNPPTNVVGTPGDGRVFVTWSAPSSHPELVSEYVVTAQPGDHRCEATAPATSCLLSSVTNGVAYSLSVVARNTVGTSSAAVSATTVTPRQGSIGPRPARTWGLDRIDQRSKALDAVYAPPSDGNDVRLYVVDTGVRATHQDFTGRVTQGVSTVPGESSTDDCHGHGSHVASSAAGATLGVAAQATIVPVRVLDCYGSAYTSEVVAGLEWVARDVANRDVPAVVNMSLGGAADTDLDAAVEALVDQGVTVVVAAGNETADACTASPARTPGAITVGATTIEDGAATFSNMGSCVDLFAPGSKVLGAGIASDTAEATYSGTSMAAPHVAGYATVVRGMFPNLSTGDVARVIVGAATTNILSGLWAATPNKLLFVASSKCEVAALASVDCATGIKVDDPPLESGPVDSIPSPSDSQPAAPVTSTPVSMDPGTTVPATTVADTQRPTRAVAETPPTTATPVVVAPVVVAFAEGPSRTVAVPRPPSQSAATAPRVAVTQNAAVALRVPALPKRSQPTVSVKSRHGSVALGKLRVDRRGTLRMPKLSFTKTGIYTFSFKVGKRTFFTKVSVTRPARATALSQRSVTVAR